MTATAHAAPGVTPVRGWIGQLTSTDHKRMGLNLGIGAIVFFLVGGVFALLMRTQLAQPDTQFLSDNSYNELFTMHGSTMIYLFVTPMAIAMALYLVPLQIGAIGLSGARVALSGFWMWLSGGLIMQSGWLTSDGPGRSGWFSYTPVSQPAEDVLLRPREFKHLLLEPPASLVLLRMSAPAAATLKRERFRWWLRRFLGLASEVGAAPDVEEPLWIRMEEHYHG